MRRNMLFLSLFLGPLAIVACGGGGGGTGGNGNGGGTTTASTTDTNSSTGSTSTGSTTGSTTSSTTTSSGTGGAAPTGQCTNTVDLGIIQDPTKDVQGNAGTCGKNNIFSKDMIKPCIITATGLSDGCAQCFADTVICAIDKCIAQCAADPSSQGCTDCRKTNCDPAFYACSGLPQD